MPNKVGTGMHPCFMLLLIMKDSDHTISKLTVTLVWLCDFMRNCFSAATAIDLFYLQCQGNVGWHLLFSAFLLKLTRRKIVWIC